MAFLLAFVPGDIHILVLPAKSIFQPVIIFIDILTMSNILGGIKGKGGFQKIKSKLTGFFFIDRRPKSRIFDDMGKADHLACRGTDSDLEFFFLFFFKKTDDPTKQIIMQAVGSNAAEAADA